MFVTVCIDIVHVCVGIICTCQKIHVQHGVKVLRNASCTNICVKIMKNNYLVDVLGRRKYTFCFTRSVAKISPG